MNGHDGEMTRWQRIDLIFDEALGLGEDEQETFLDRQCAGEPEIRREVELLLAADRRAEGFLEPASVGQVGPGDHVGPYRLLRLIGEGGMGKVFMAVRDDDTYHRRVAVKLIGYPGAGAALAERFRLERQALARLEHPKIARLYDGGSTEAGQPYLVMEYVDGEPLTKHCDRQRMSINERLEIFCQVCDAVSHAHRNLVVHRDIKPSNILVGEDGVPRLLDFGIAKVLRDPELEADGFATRTGERLFTPGYASPEQVLGLSASTSCDVYSLGVVLYELLTGTSPYRLSQPSPHEVEQAVLTQEPVRPSSRLGKDSQPANGNGQQRSRCAEICSVRRTTARELSRRLRGDLDNIVLRAVAKEPDLRYSSVDELAEDVRRHLAQLPVLARAPTLRYRACKFVRRNRLAVALGCVAAVLAVAFVASLMLQSARLARERDSARFERDRAEQVLGYVTGLFRQAAPSYSKGEPVTVLEVLELGAEGVSRTLQDKPQIQADLMRRIANIYVALGQFEKARVLFSQALEVQRSLEEPGSEALARAVGGAADGLALAGDHEGAETLAREALQIYRERKGDDHPKTVTAVSLLAGHVENQGRLQEAEALHRKVLEQRLAIFGPEHRLAGFARWFLGATLRQLGDYDAAELESREAERVLRAVLGEDNRIYPQCLDNLGLLMVATSRYDEAAEILGRSLEIRRKILEPEHPELAVSLANTAKALRGQGKLDEAASRCRQALQISRKTWGPRHQFTIRMTSFLGQVLCETGRVDEAIELHREAVSLQAASGRAHHPDVATYARRLAECLSARGMHDEALEMLDDAVTLLRDRPVPRLPDLGMVLETRGRVLLLAGRAQAAEVSSREALEILSAYLPADHPELALTQCSFAECLAAVGRADEALVLARTGHATLLGRFGERDHRSRRARRSLEAVQASAASSV